MLVHWIGKLNGASHLSPLAFKAIESATLILLSSPLIPQTTIKWETWVLRKYAIKAGAPVYIGGDTLLKLTFKLHSLQTVRESCSNT